ncbi:MAG: aspartyl protease family protein [Hyphomicrobiaceae bacterium]|nr:aspartyl protease family protein [Hyphomicrobiaceae bacterium]
MLGYRPIDDRWGAPRRQGGGSVLPAVALTIVVLAIAAFVFRSNISDMAGITAFRPSATADTQFAALYSRYEMEPLAANIAARSNVQSVLSRLQSEPCDKRVVYQASLALEGIQATRSAAQLLEGFSGACPAASGEHYRSAELYYLLGDYAKASDIAGKLIRQQPDAQLPYYLRARAEQGLGRFEAALDDFAAFVQLIPDGKAIKAEVFTRMSESYESIGRNCEAIAPLLTYVAFEPSKRMTPALEKRVLLLSSNGNCAQSFAQGEARFPRAANGVTKVKLKINGAEGTFIVDTGASFVSVPRSFASKANAQVVKADKVTLLTANGLTSASLASVDVQLAGLSAKAVPAVVMDKDFGHGIDGLLGMSFLSRFTMVMDSRELQLKAKSLSPTLDPGK